MILLKQHRISILNYFSYTEKINLKWLQYLVYGIGSIWVLTFLEEELIFAGVVLFVLFIGYFGIKQVGIFTYQNLNKQLPKAVPDTSGALVQQGTNNLIENETTPQLTEFSKANSSAQEPLEQATIQEEKVEGKKYSKSGLSEKGAGNLHEKLSKLMADEKVYMESELSLSKLANRLGTLPNYLSQVINEKEGKTFYDYINTLRIEEFKRLISIPENKKFTFLSLSYDCGFNSKSSFNKNFKKATGLSPSEYLNR
ncbi:MAG: helix-turn-helix domain-containing protein [Sediminibacterium sp.]|nr:helix-turn-helix domain-containing protein [Sediminibacterium sp.]MDP3665577.1 helix-turn-helix domain-containing protein [Sediminibacterium sp.]